MRRPHGRCARLMRPAGLAEGLEQPSHAASVGPPGEHVHHGVQREVQGHADVGDAVEGVGVGWVRVELRHKDGHLERHDYVRNGIAKNVNRI